MKVVCLVLTALCVCWMMYIVVVRKHIIVLTCLYIANVYYVIKYSSFFILTVRRGLFPFSVM